MAFKLKSYRELVAMTQEMLDEVLLPLRVKSAKNRAEAAVLKLQEKLLSIERQINEACAKKEVDFDQVGDLMDDYDIAERRLNQINEVVAALFPGKGEKA